MYLTSWLGTAGAAAIRCPLGSTVAMGCSPSSLSNPMGGLNHMPPNCYSKPSCRPFPTWMCIQNLQTDIYEPHSSVRMFHMYALKCHMSHENYSYPIPLYWLVDRYLHHRLSLHIITIIITNKHIGMIYTSSGPSRKEGKRGRTGPAPTCTLPSLRDTTQWTLVKTSTLWSLMRPTPRTGRFHYESLVSPAPPCEPS